MSKTASQHTGQNSNRSQNHTTKHLRGPRHLRPADSAGARRVRPWHVALSVVLTASLVVAGLHTDAIADVLGLSATAEPEQVTETAQPAAGDAATADTTGAAAPDELASAERETEETGRAAAEEIEREADEAAARAAEEERASGVENGSGGVPHRTA